MSQWIAVAGVDELSPGVMKAVSAGGREILLARVGDSYYAVNNRCPHLGGKFSEGKLEGTVVTCPWHGSQFDLRDGHVIRWTTFTGLVAKVNQVIKSPRPVATYKVKTEGNSVLIEV